MMMTCGIVFLVLVLARCAVLFLLTSRFLSNFISPLCSSLPFFSLLSLCSASSPPTKSPVIAPSVPNPLADKGVLAGVIIGSVGGAGEGKQEHILVYHTLSHLITRYNISSHTPQQNLSHLITRYNISSHSTCIWKYTERWKCSDKTHTYIPTYPPFVTTRSIFYNL